MPFLRFSRRVLPLLLALVFSAFALGQDYYWVDSEGNKHYGKRVEPNHQGPDAERGDSTSRSEASRHSNSRSGNCDAQWEAYDSSAACFARCRTPSGNIAGCGHCRQMKKPNC